MKRVLMGIVWFVALYAVAIMLGSAITGGMPTGARGALLFIIAVVAAIVGALSGILPGTRRASAPKKRDDSTGADD